ncbi:MAG: Stk1 family PASTA domain-containing Ser/Thr kinase [Streptosporangiales bacterium]
MSEPRVLGGRYELGMVIGRGGMAEVHRGRDIRLEREVAVKTLRADLARDPTFQARFRREAQSAAQLNHPSVVAVYDTGEESYNGTALPYIVMEYVEGQTLRDVLRDTHQLMPQRALEMLAGVLKALAYSHRMGIVHRDIKPANVMLNRNNEIKVMDFGIARSVSDSQATMTQTAQVIGTAQYLSPEQARGDKVDARSDLYATGCVLYELLTGRPPFSGDSPVSVAYQHVREDPVPPSRVNPDVPPAIDAIVLKAMAKNPENRYQSADEMRADIERALGGLPVHATPVLDADPTEQIGAPTAATALLPAGEDDYTDEDEKPRRKKRRKAIGLTLLALALVALLIGGLIGGNAWMDRQQAQAMAKVPDVTGDNVDIARTKLDNKGFEVNTKEKFSAKDEGTVLGQDPKAGKQLRKGKTVTLTVSKGRQMVTVPTLEGQRKKDAKQAIEDAGLTVGAVSRKNSEEHKNTVLSSDPAAGESVAKGSTVNLVVSNGKVKVPNVVNESRQQAKADLSAAGFDVKTVWQERSDYEAGIVFAQSPDGGTHEKQGHQVIIYVAQEPEPTETTTAPSPTPTETTPTTSTPSETDTFPFGANRNGHGHATHGPRAQ